MTRYLMAIDQGTTSSRAMIFDDQGQAITCARQEFPQYYPQDGWVEHDGMEILESVLSVVRDALSQLPHGTLPSAIGITNQRETTLIWDKKTGEPIYPAIVWQDRRTADYCQKLKNDGHEKPVRKKTGLLLDPYFSATKIAWILDHVENARKRAKQGELLFGTVDSFLLWHLSGGQVHKTDVTNASRTLLYNIQDKKWDPDLLELFDIPTNILPEVHACDHHFGDVSEEIFGFNFPITAMAGDQQAALIGQDCLKPGQIKCTYGTGGFIMMNIGRKPVLSRNQLLTTVAYEIQGKTAYALEGSFFCAGSTIQWLRDGLKIITHAADTAELARSIDHTNGVYLVPAFTGLGAPHWDPHARGSLFGLTRATGVAEIARAALESVGFQTADLLAAMQQDSNMAFDSLKVDGGMVENDWLLQFLANIMQLKVIKPTIPETTSYGIAMLAGLNVGIFDTLNEISRFYCYDESLAPNIIETDIIKQLNNWKKAVKSTRCYSGR